MAEGFELQASVRERVGKGAARKLRREGLIPAVIYGNKEAPLPIAISYRDAFQRLHAGGFLTNIWTIDVDGQTIRALARDYQLEPVKDFLVHVDFLRVTATTRVAVDVPVHFIGEEDAPGLVKGGALNVVRHTIEVECPADRIPNLLEVNLSGLDFGDSVHASSIALPEGVQFTITDRDFTIATITAPVAEVVEEVEEEEAEEALVSVEEESEAGEAPGEEEAE